MNANKMFKLPNNTGPKPNTSLKVNRPSSNVPFNTSSFVNATDAVSNAANNAAKSVVNTANQVVNKANDVINNAANTAKNMGSNMMSFLPEPVVDSMNSSLESNTSPFISIPVIIGLGVLIILFIIIAITCIASLQLQEDMRSQHAPLDWPFRPSREMVSKSALGDR